jgi:hypothetical protein
MGSVVIVARRCGQASYIDHRIAYYLGSVSLEVQPSGAVKNVTRFERSVTVTTNAFRAQTVRAVDIVRRGECCSRVRR